MARIKKIKAVAVVVTSLVFALMFVGYQVGKSLAAGESEAIGGAAE